MFTCVCVCLCMSALCLYQGGLSTVLCEVDNYFDSSVLMCPLITPYTCLLGGSHAAMYCMLLYLIILTSFKMLDSSDPQTTFECFKLKVTLSN